MANKIECVVCGNGFIAPRSDARTCSTACRSKRYRRGRRPVTDDTDSGGRPDPATTPPAPPPAPVRAPGEHCAEAVAVLAGLDAELAQNSKRMGLSRPLVWSTAESAVRELIADTIDRRTALMRLYEQCDDPRLVLSFSAELRLLEASVARLLRQIKTDMPAAPSLTSVKARNAAMVRHHGPGAS